jgi:hypothetical protein
VVLAWSLVSCDGGASAAKARDAADAAVGEIAPADRPADAGEVASPRDAPATRPAATGAPLPPGVPPARRILEPGASLTGGGEGSCTHQWYASGQPERWCVFMRPESNGKSALWVMNVTRAAAAPPVCDGSDPACLRLTGDVWTGGGLNGPFQPYANRFFGDTLIFYADARSGPQEVHRGPVFAWRPGWAQARRISTDDALECWGHPSALLAHCVEALQGDPVQPDSFELRAGAIGDRDDVVLPSLGRIQPRDAEGSLAWQAGFSPAGDQFAVSHVDASRVSESLHVIATDRLGQPGAALAEVVTKAQHWQIGNDGKRVFFVRQAAGGGHGLFVADFPGGTNPTPLDADVSDYFVLGPQAKQQDRGVGFVSTLGPDKGAFRLTGSADGPSGAAAPTTIFTFERGLDGLRVSPDLRFTAWRDPDFRVQIVQHDPLSACRLNASANQPAFGISFLEHAGLVFWTEGDGGDRDRRNGYFANPAGCLDKRRFAQSVYFLVPVGDRGLIFADEVDDDSQRTTLKYAAVAEGKRFDPQNAVRVHEEIDGTSVLLVGDPLLLLFTVSTGPAAQQGTYLFGPVPF